MNVLVACEESQRVCIEFRKLGHNAFSCDIQECSGGHPEWHIKDNVLKYLNGASDDFCCADLVFKTQNGDKHILPWKWDLIIAHPPCTRLCNSGQRWLYFGSEDYRNQKLIEQKNAIDFFLKFTDINCDHVAIENPVGIMSSIYRKPDCKYNPYDFIGETECKTTCLWLKGLPNLLPTRSVPLDISERTHSIFKGKFNNKNLSWGSSECSRLRSQTPVGVARAMAEQWGTAVTTNNGSKID